MKFKIDMQILREMAQLAVKNTIDTSHLDWTATQQVLTLWSLQELYKSYGMEVDFELDVFIDPKLKEDKVPNVNE